MDNLLEQMKQDDILQQITNITKAHGFDILSNQVKELKEIINQLINVGELEDITFTDDADTAEFQDIVRRAKIISN